MVTGEMETQHGAYGFIPSGPRREEGTRRDRKTEYPPHLSPLFSPLSSLLHGLCTAVVRPSVFNLGLC